jgi:hypothetical protein
LNEILKVNLTIKTLSDKKIKVPFENDNITLGQVKEFLILKSELPIEKEFFVYQGKVYRDSNLSILQLPNFKSFQKVLTEFKENNLANSAGIKSPDDLLPPLYLFYFEESARSIDPIEIASDWDQKNRLKVFKGIWSLSTRNLKEAANLLVEVLPSFSETNFINFVDLVKYAVITSAVVFDRPTLKSKV